jgi:hypothetical protein
MNSFEFKGKIGWKQHVLEAESACGHIIDSRMCKHFALMLPCHRVVDDGCLALKCEVH